MKVLAIIGAILLPLGAVLFFFAAMGRIDSSEEYRGAQVMDVVIGALLAASFVLRREGEVMRRLRTVVGAAA